MKFAWLGILLCVSCSHPSPVRDPGGSPDAARTSSPAGDLADSSVWVLRPDGSKQCGINEKIETVESGAALLKNHGVPVLEASKGRDGLLHAQMCGAPSGRANRYRIPADKFDLAQGLGFRRDTASAK